MPKVEDWNEREVSQTVKLENDGRRVGVWSFRSNLSRSSSCAQWLKRKVVIIMAMGGSNLAERRGETCLKSRD
jgi:hypothetical protein